jgi:hypothetical protein
MKLVGLLLLLWVSLAGLSAQDVTGEKWVRRPPGNFTWDEWKELPATDVFEVVASKESVAIARDLAEKQIVLIEEKTGKYFAGANYQCPPGKKAYLVRAVYGHGGTGGYKVLRRGNEILIHHSSLGRSSPTRQSAVVVNLDFTPTAVYLDRSIAE